MNKTIYIVGGGAGGYTEMFQNNDWEIKDNMEDASFVLFTGGEDVSPHLYGEKNVASGNNIRRDDYEVAMVKIAKELGKNLLGICRGSQFLTVMSGHSLWQDVDAHGIWGTHDAVDADGEVIKVTSTHHQMMRLDGTTPYQLLLTAGRTTKKIGYHNIVMNDLAPDRDIEAVYYPETKAFAFQPHPEIVGKDHICQTWYFETINKLYG